MSINYGASYQKQIQFARWIVGSLNRVYELDYQPTPDTYSQGYSTCAYKNSRKNRMTKSCHSRTLITRTDVVRHRRKYRREKCYLLPPSPADNL
jgi:hypothetical protein